MPSLKSRYRYSHFADEGREVSERSSRWPEITQLPNGRTDVKRTLSLFLCGCLAVFTFSLKLFPYRLYCYFRGWCKSCAQARPPGRWQFQLYLGVLERRKRQSPLLCVVMRLWLGPLARAAGTHSFGRGLRPVFASSQWATCFSGVS